MKMNLPIEKVVSILCAKPADFTLVHFRDTTHEKNAPAHFWVSISMGSDQHILLSIVTTQMSKLEQRYVAEEEEKALDSLVPLSGSDFKEIKKPCVINCNETMLLSTQKLLERIDTTFCSPISKNCFDFIHYDKDFDSELKNRIIHAIYNSPYILPEVKNCIDELQLLQGNDSG
jgi:hypothetical protein